MPPRTNKVTGAGASASASECAGAVIPNLILVSKNGDIEAKPVSSNGAFDFTGLYKMCGFRKMENFERRHTWRVAGGSSQFITLFAKNEGKGDSENKYPLPEFDADISKKRYYGTICFVYSKTAELTGGSVLDLNVDIWAKLYKKLMEGDGKPAMSVATAPAPTAITKKSNTGVPKKQMESVAPIKPVQNKAMVSADRVVAEKDDADADEDEDDEDEEDDANEKPHGFLSDDDDDEDDEDDDDEEDEEDGEDDAMDDEFIEKDLDTDDSAPAQQNVVISKNPAGHLNGVGGKVVTGVATSASTSTSTSVSKTSQKQQNAVKPSKTSISVVASKGKQSGMGKGTGTGKGNGKGKAKGKAKTKPKRTKKSKSGDDFDGDDIGGGGGEDDFDDADEYEASDDEDLVYESVASALKAGGAGVGTGVSAALGEDVDGLYPEYGVEYVKQELNEEEYDYN